MIDTNPDPFVIPGTDNVLRNNFSITDKGRLSYYEGAFATFRMMELVRKPIEGKHDLGHLCAIHRHIFQDIYPWAGQTRENLHLLIGKARPDGTPVTYPPGPMAIAQARKILAELQAENHLQGKTPDMLAGRLAHYYAELDYCHVFREGNSRTLRAFTASIARQAGYNLSWEHMRNRQEELYRARDHAAFSMPSEKLPDPLAPLAGIIREGFDRPADRMD